MASDTTSPNRFRQLVYRALRLRCPVCGEGRLFPGFFRTLDHCPACDSTIEREPGFFLGAIYFNYGLTALMTLVGYGILRIGLDLPSKTVMAITITFVFLFPIWFHRYARSLWLGFDEYHDPRGGRPVV